jgi:hypothetical protein
MWQWMLEPTEVIVQEETKLEEEMTVAIEGASSSAGTEGRTSREPSSEQIETESVAEGDISAEQEELENEEEIADEREDSVNETTCLIERLVGTQIMQISCGISQAFALSGTT